MRFIRPLCAALVAGALGACAQSPSGVVVVIERDASTEPPGDASGDARDRDASGTDGAAPGGDGGLDGTASSDAGDPADAATDAGRDAGALDPDLGLPAPGGPSCTTPGNLCAAGVCRIAGPDSGRCERCTACRHLFESCTSSDDCDIVFQCFRGRCTNICELGTVGCGLVQDCIDVGHATHGVCRP